MASNNAYGPQIVTDGLVLCLDANNAKSYPGAGTAWYDLSGNGNNGTLTNGPTFSADEGGGSMVFDGASGDDSIPITKNNLPLVDNISHTAWVKSTSISDSQNIWSQNGPIFMRIVSSKLRMGFYTGSWFYENGPTTLSSNTWYYFVTTFDGYTARAYINGNKEMETSKVGSLASNASIYVGYTPAVGEQAGFAGYISRVCRYNKTLSHAEIKQNYNALRSRFGK